MPRGGSILRRPEAPLAALTKSPAGGPPDPVFAAIEVHRRTHAELDRVCSSLDEAALAGDKGARRKLKRLHDAYTAAADGLLKTSPATITGLSALLTYAADHVSLGNEWPDGYMEERPLSGFVLRYGVSWETILHRNLGAALIAWPAREAKKLPAAHHSTEDPIFAALDALRLAEVERNEAEESRSLRETMHSPLSAEQEKALKRYHTAIDRECDTRERVCSVVPTTVAGVVAFLRFIKNELLADAEICTEKLSAKSDEVAVKQSLAGLEQALTALASQAKS
jgi:hypothetical protein